MSVISRDSWPAVAGTALTLVLLAIGVWRAPTDLVPIGWGATALMVSNGQRHRSRRAASGTSCPKRVLYSPCTKKSNCSLTSSAVRPA